MNARGIWLIAKSVLIEAVRRREIYAIILVATLLIGAIMTVDFFDLQGLTKFYREVALKIMSIATVLTAIVLAARQLPREFENRTIYPLMAKPVSRTSFLIGKLFGVMLSAAFCFAIFMIIFVAGTFYLGGEIPWVLFVQFIYLQMILILVMTALSFWLSMMLNLDAAITIGVLLYIFAATLMSMTTYIYDYTGALGQRILQFLTFAIPQLPLFDLSEKAVHAQFWEPLSARILSLISIYGLVYASLYFGLAMLWFRRKPL